LPENVEEKSIRAETKDGVLYVHLPKKAKTEKTMPVQIKVE
jgi:HSP20 family molecular chaperone IbpA